MSRSLILIFFLFGYQIEARPQLFSGAQKFLLPTNLLNALDQNQQQLNPAASHPKAQKGIQIYASAPFQIPNLNGAHFSYFYRYKQIAIYHELSGVMHPASQLYQTAHALALTPYPGLRIGLGLQLQLLTQPSFYGNVLVGSARLGCQYQLNKQQYLALVINEIGRPAQQQISLEHVLSLDAHLYFAQGFSWNPQFKPSAYLAIIQKLKGAKLQFTCGLFPQSFAFSVAVSTKQKFTWLIGQTWQSSHGLSFQIGFNFR
jgi:hypothetical protein